MNQTINSSFQRIPVSESELVSGSILSAMQIAVIQNLRVDIAEQKLNLTFTPNDVLSYTQQEAFLKGQLEILLHLIDTSEAAQQSAVQKAAVQSHTNTQS
jgi:hypothetical protein